MLCNYGGSGMDFHSNIYAHFDYYVSGCIPSLQDQLQLQLRLEVCCCIRHIPFAHWIRDNSSGPHQSDDDKQSRKRLKTILWISNVMFAVENITLISLFYNYSKFVVTWDAFPLTVYVCLSSIVGATIRLIHFQSLLKYQVRSETNATNDQLAFGLDSGLEVLNFFEMASAAAGL